MTNDWLKQPPYLIPEVDDIDFEALMTDNWSQDEDVDPAFLPWHRTRGLPRNRLGELVQPRRREVQGGVLRVPGADGLSRVGPRL